MIQEGQDTHLLSLSSKFNVIDGSVHGQFTEDYYYRHHKIGVYTIHHLKRQVETVVPSMCILKFP